MSVTAGLVRSLGRSTDADAMFDLAARSLEEGEEEQALPLIGRAAARERNARLWQWKGLLERSLDEHEPALASFEEAARLAPADATIAHGHARVALEAGIDARPLYERAIALDSRNGEPLLGMAAARVAAGEGDLAIAELQAVLDRAPAWTDGHEHLAQLLSTQGRAAEATSLIEQALQRFPAAQPLWESLLRVELRRAAYDRLDAIIGRAKAAGVRRSVLQFYEAVHAAECDDEAFPDALFASADAALEKALAIWRIRHLLRLGRLDALLPLIDRELQAEPSAELFAYAASAWRLANDPRSSWLEQDERFVRVFDLAAELPPLASLAGTLRALHVAKGEYLDQSVRGGTQTDGPLFSRIDPLIRELRTAVAGAVEAYVAGLPPADAGHPLLRERRDRRIRFAGSWSVRLRSGGRHSNHVHPHGWISSALYVALPAKTPGEPGDAGWFTLGEPDDALGLSFPPWRTIEPRPGRLVLFPSWMWHGTRPFEQGERLTVAFDVAVPR